MARIPEDAVAAALERLLAGGLDRPTAAIG
jgi:hypothetical protein